MESGTPGVKTRRGGSSHLPRRTRGDPSARVRSRRSCAHASRDGPALAIGRRVSRPARGQSRHGAGSSKNVRRGGLQSARPHGHWASTRAAVSRRARARHARERRAVSTAQPDVIPAADRAADQRGCRLEIAFADRASGIITPTRRATGRSRSGSTTSRAALRARNDIGEAAAMACSSDPSSAQGCRERQSRHRSRTRKAMIALGAA